jgi:hypothetical protein
LAASRVQPQLVDKKSCPASTLSRAMTLQEEDRGRLVDVPGYGKRIERYFPGAGARAPDDRVEFLVGDFVDAQFASFVVQLGHAFPCFLGEGRPSHARWTQ